MKFLWSIALVLIGTRSLYFNLTRASAPKLISIVVFGVPFLGTALAIVYLNDRWKERLARKAGETGADGRVARQLNARSHRAAWVFVGFLILISILLGGLPIFGRFGIVPFLVILILGSMAALSVIFVPAVRTSLPFRLLLDDDAQRAHRKASRGDVQGAIEDLFDLIDTKGPSASRSAALGDCFLLARNWSKACIQFRDAERYDGSKGRYLGKEGYALLKLGRAAEAADLLRKASANNPKVVSHALNRCMALADLRRTEEARSELQRAERLIKKWQLLGGNKRRELETSLKECQIRLENE